MPTLTRGWMWASLALVAANFFGDFHEKAGAMRPLPFYFSGYANFSTVQSEIKSA